MAQRWYNPALATSVAVMLVVVRITDVAGSPVSYDVTKFETSILDKWIEQYKVSGQPGNYSMKPKTNIPHPYSPSDVLHVLCFTGRLGGLNDTDKNVFASAIKSFQRSDGFFDHEDSHGQSGGSLWHAAGYVTAGLTLIDRFPLYRNTLFEAIVSDTAVWQATIDALLNVDSKKPPMNISSGCSTGYPCAQNIASLMSWFMMTNASTNGLGRHVNFVNDYYTFLAGKADASSGLWCSDDQRKKNGLINCIGGSFHIDFVFQHHTLVSPAQRDSTPTNSSSLFPFPKQQMDSALSLQLPSGGWTGDGIAYLNVDGIYQVTRPGVQLNKQYRWDDAETACDRLMKLVTGVLNDESKVLGPSVSSQSHALPALVAAVAECQKHFPDMVKTTRPWPMCLDAVPYI
eukprot:m.70808 g.70808  ORF g.70808 m.70808 type:complete len:401 (-) comp16059_c0_seq8:1282-2484(-)